MENCEDTGTKPVSSQLLRNRKRIMLPTCLSPVPQIMEAIGQASVLPVPQINEDMVEVIQPVPREGINEPWRRLVCSPRSWRPSTPCSKRHLARVVDAALADAPAPEVRMKERHAGLIRRGPAAFWPYHNVRSGPEALTAGGVWHGERLSTQRPRLHCCVPVATPSALPERHGLFQNSLPKMSICMFRSCTCLSLYTYLNSDITDK